MLDTFYTSPEFYVSATSGLGSQRSEANISAMPWCHERPVNSEKSAAILQLKHILLQLRHIPTPSFLAFALNPLTSALGMMCPVRLPWRRSDVDNGCRVM